MSDEELREYVAKVLSIGPGGAGRTAAPVVTLSLALRVHNMAQAMINTGACAETNKLVVLALVILEMAGVHPPSDRGEVEQVGQRWDVELAAHTDRLKLMRRRGNKPETRARQVKEEEEAALPWPWGEWPAPGTTAKVPRVQKRVERDGAGLTYDELARENKRLRPEPARAKRAEKRTEEARDRAMLERALADSLKEAAREERKKRKQESKKRKRAEHDLGRAETQRQRAEEQGEKMSAAASELKVQRDDAVAAAKAAAAQTARLERTASAAVRDREVAIQKAKEERERLQRKVDAKEAKLAAELEAAQQKVRHLRELKAAMAAKKREAEAAASAAERATQRDHQSQRPINDRESSRESGYYCM